MGSNCTGFDFRGDLDLEVVLGAGNDDALWLLARGALRGVTPPCGFAPQIAGGGDLGRWPCAAGPAPVAALIIGVDSVCCRLASPNTGDVDPDEKVVEEAVTGGAATEGVQEAPFEEAEVGGLVLPLASVLSAAAPGNDATCSA